jgi:hypothetical protein
MIEGPHPGSPEAAELLSQIIKISRLLLAQDPSYGEGAAIGPSQELEELVERERGAVKFIERDGSVAYIVVEHGQRWTTSRPPAGYDIDELPVVHAPQGEPALWPMVQEAAAQLRVLDAKAYNDAEVDNILSALRPYYDSNTDPHLADNLALLSVLPSGLQLPEGKFVDDGIARQWAHDSILRVLESYMLLQLSGNAAAGAAAVFLIFVSFPRPGELYTVGTGWYSSELGDIRPVPTIDCSLYLSWANEMQLSVGDFAVHVAKMAKERADSWRDEADEDLAFGEFHNKLYVALMYYQMALLILSDLLGHPKLRHLPLSRSIRRETKILHTICEEHRVTILTSLASVVSPRQTLPDFTSFSWWEGWLRSLLDLDVELARQDIDDRYVRLIFPVFYRDLALACTLLDRPEYRAEGVTRADEIIARWQRIGGQLSPPWQMASLHDRLQRAS